MQSTARPSLPYLQAKVATADKQQADWGKAHLEELGKFISAHGLVRLLTLPEEHVAHDCPNQLLLFLQAHTVAVAASKPQIAGTLLLIGSGPCAVQQHWPEIQQGRAEEHIAWLYAEFAGPSSLPFQTRLCRQSPLLLPDMSLSARQMPV